MSNKVVPDHSPPRDLERSTSSTSNTPTPIPAAVEKRFAQKQYLLTSNFQKQEQNLLWDRFTRSDLRSSRNGLEKIKRD